MFTKPGRLVLLAGFVLIAVGVVCLYLSDAVAHGWWQGTLDAFGVGFIVGGLVDVLAISGLTQVMQTGRDQREAGYRKRAEEILAQIPPGHADEIMRVLRDDNISPEDRAAVLRRLDWRQRDALLRQLDPKQYDVLWPQVYRTRA